MIGEQLRGRSVILDGELVCPGAEGKPDFTARRARLGRQGGRVAIAAQRTPVKLVAFDVLHLAGRAVRELPCARRRELLAEFVVDGPSWRAPRYFVGEAEALLAVTAQQGLEGVVAKRLDAPYAEGRRSRAWIKHKHRRRERLVVTGWRERPDDLPEFLRARRAADGDLRPAGSASLGLDATRRRLLLAALEDLAVSAPPRRGAPTLVWGQVRDLASGHLPEAHKAGHAAYRKLNDINWRVLRRASQEQPGRHPAAGRGTHTVGPRPRPGELHPRKWGIHLSTLDELKSPAATGDSAPRRCQRWNARIPFVSGKSG